MQHSVWDNTGPALPGMSMDDQPPNISAARRAAIADMHGFDQVRKQARETLCGMCVKFSSLQLLSYIQERWPTHSPKGSTVDTAVAELLRRKDPLVVEAIRKQFDAELQQRDTTT